MKVLIITYYWPPSGGAGVQRTLKFTRYLPQFGVEPIVLTVDAAIASYPQRDESLMQEVDPTLNVIRTNSFEPLSILSRIAGKDKVPYGGFANVSSETFFQKTLRWVRGNFFIPDARVGWVNYAVKAAKKIIEEEKIQAIYISSPPHSSQLIGLRLKKYFPAIRWIADLRDPWTTIYYYQELLHTKIAARKDFLLERSVLMQCDAAIVVSASIKRDFLRNHSLISPEKIQVIPNGFDEKDFENVIAPDRENFIITYVGTIADSYQPEVFFNALQQVIKQHSATNIIFRFIGSAPDAIRNLVVEKGIEKHCEWISYVPHEEAIAYMKKSNVLLLIIPDVKGAEGILTGKLFEYIGAGRPVLAIGPVEGDAAKILTDCNAGSFFERTEINAITDFIKLKYDKWKSGDEEVNSSERKLKYSRRELTKKLALLINN